MPCWSISDKIAMGLFGPSIPAISEIMLIGETAVAAVLIISWVLARKHKGSLHHCLMLGAFLADLLIFKPLMIVRAADGSVGYFPWDGSSILIHLAISALVAVIGIYAIIIGLKNVVRKEKKMFLPPKGKMHRVVGGIFMVAWFATYAIGLWLFVRLNI